jgi:hypothetical protein
MQRLGLLGPLVRMHRRIEEWESAAGASPPRRLSPGTQLRTLGDR